MEIINKEDAKKTNLDTYFTGKACKRGHFSVRYVSSSGCVKCSKIKSEEWYTDNKERKLAVAKEWEKENSERRRKSFLIYREQNKDKLTQQRAQRTIQNKERNTEYLKIYKQGHKENYALASKRWRERHPEKVKAAAALQRANKFNRTPVWVDLGKIKEFYRNCPTGMEVDHIIPLRGKLVSGLHTHINLQYLTREQNRTKSNFFEVQI